MSGLHHRSTEKEGIVNQLEKHSDPIRVQAMEELGFHQRVVIAAKYLGNTMGYIWVQESSRLLENEELAFLEEISPHLGNLINDMYAKVNIKKDRKEEVLWHLLQHEYGSESQLRHDASLVKLTLPERFTVAVYSIASSQYKSMLDQLEKLVQESSFHNKHLYVKDGIPSDSRSLWQS